MKNNISEFHRINPQQTMLFTVGQMWVDGHPGEECRIAWEKEPTIEEIVNLRFYLAKALEDRGVRWAN